MNHLSAMGFILVSMVVQSISKARLSMPFVNQDTALMDQFSDIVLVKMSGLVPNHCVSEVMISTGIVCIQFIITTR